MNENKLVNKDYLFKTPQANKLLQHFHSKMFILYRDRRKLQLFPTQISAIKVP